MSKSNSCAARDLLVSDKSVKLFEGVSVHMCTPVEEILCSFVGEPEK